jgi:hypothetical protein
MPTLLSDLINTIPVARREDVISPESHNSMRDAIVAIVTELGGAVASQNVTLTFAPAFLVISPEDKWVVEIGYAHNQRNPTGSAVGWLPLQLPDGSRIQQLRVWAGRTGPLDDPPSQMDVKLQRQLIRGGPFAETLAKVSLVGPRNLQDVFERNAPFTNDPVVNRGPNRPPANIVDNGEFKYFVRADLLRAPDGSFVNIFAIMVDCRLG